MDASLKYVVSDGNFAPILIVAISMVLTHFFVDSDRYRSFCEKLRAKYILREMGPMDYQLDQSSRNDIKDMAEIYEDFLMARLTEIHFGIVSLITISGLIVTQIIIGYSIWYFKGKGSWSWMFCCVFIIYFLITSTYIAQQCVTARRLKELRHNKIGSHGSYFEQGYKLLGTKVDSAKYFHHYLSSITITCLLCFYDRVCLTLYGYCVKLLQKVGLAKKTT